MSILIDKNTRVVVQGITGRDGSFHTRSMIEYGTKVVAGVTPGKGGETFDGIPVFDTVAEAVRVTGANTSVIYVPVAFAIDAIFEAADSGVDLVICITEGLPVRDMLRVYRYLKNKGVRLVGPNCPGLITPGVCKVGIMPGPIVKKGNVGVISRSGTLTYEVVYNLTIKKLGQSTCIGIGGDPVIGTNFIDCLQMFEKDKATEAVVLIGEIGGNDEEEAAQYIKKHMTKPVVGFIAGRTAPPGKRMGHAGAIISGGSGTAAEKVRAFRAVGVEVAETPAEIAELVEGELKKLAKKSAKRKTLKVVAVKTRTVSKAARAAKKSKVGAKKKAAAKKSPAKKKAAPKKRAVKKIAKKKVTKKKVVKKIAKKKTAPKKKVAKKKVVKKPTKKNTAKKPAKKTAKKKPAVKRRSRKQWRKRKPPKRKQPRRKNKTWNRHF